jgi:hypothetical protein
MVFEGWPGEALPWRKGIEIMPGCIEGETVSGWLVVASGSNKLMVPRTFATQEEAITWVDVTHRAAVEDSQRPGLVVKRPDLAHVRREGFPSRRSGPIATETIRVEFGFRRVSLSPQMSSAEARAILEMAWDAFQDFADLLDLPPKAMSLGGRLSLSIGGKSRPAARRRTLRRPAR